MQSVAAKTAEARFSVCPHRARIYFAARLAAICAMYHTLNPVLMRVRDWVNPRRFQLTRTPPAGGGLGPP